MCTSFSMICLLRHTPLTLNVTTVAPVTAPCCVPPQEHCKELELLLTQAHFDREELENELNALAAAEQHAAAAQGLKHKLK
jgi:hypothetical protein